MFCLQLFEERLPKGGKEPQTPVTDNVVREAKSGKDFPDEKFGKIFGGECCGGFYEDSHFGELVNND